MVNSNAKIEGVEQSCGTLEQEQDVTMQKPRYAELLHETLQVDCVLLHLGVVTGLLVEDCATGPGVAKGEFAMGLAQGAATEAPRPEDGHGETFGDAVLLDGLHADHDVHAAAEQVGDEAHDDVEGVGHTLKGLPLAGHGAGAADVGVEALHRVHEALEDAGSPIATHA